ncbi:MAG: hypothetical protein ACREQL_05245, partial [Candidatus Binatia bacterium]
LQADGPVKFAKGSVKADGAPAALGGMIHVTTTAGDVDVQISLSAIQGAAPLQGQQSGQITIDGPGKLTVGGSGRLIADLGSIAVIVAGTASFADGSVVQANGGGDITMIAGSLDGFGEFRANGEFGGIDLTAITGPMTLQRLSQGLTVGPGGNVSLTTESPGTDGTLTMDSPILANGASVDLTAAGSLTVAKKIETTGIFDSGGGEVTITSDGDVQVTKAIVGDDLYSAEDIGIEAVGNVTIEGNLSTKGGLDTDGGGITVTAGGAIVVQGDIFLNVSGADSSSGGSIDLEAGRDLTIAGPVELIADGSPLGAGGSIFLEAGVDDFALERLPGNVLLQGIIKANGHATTSGNQVVIGGCAVSIPSGARIDITGDVGSANFITARTNLSIVGQLKASGANVLTFPTGASPQLTGSFTPLPSAGTCSNGTPTANGCVRAVCTADNVPTGCLYPCPQCGDNVLAFPETCEGGPSCNANAFCDAQCRTHSCTDSNPCTKPNACDPVKGCTIVYEANGTFCDNGTLCDGHEVCQGGACSTVPGTVPNCGSDQNPCTTDGCDAGTGLCFHTPLGGIQPGCTDNNPCTGTETCVAGSCQAGTLVQCPSGQVCNPTNGQCADRLCQTPAECNDGNPCTNDVCQGTCSNPQKANGTNCDDGDLCNGIRTCQSGVCQSGTPLNCNDNNVCTTDACNAATGLCQHGTVTGCCNTGADCNDGDACTIDACTPQHACTHATLSCADNNVCTNDLCNPQLGCQNPVDPTCCQTVGDCSDDADVCTDKACVANRCLQIASPNCCNQPGDCTDIDRNPCTDNGPCDMGTHRCAGPFPLTGSACGTTCNPATCQSGTCVPGLPTDCSDNNPCTSNLCTDDQGCTNPPIAECCFGSAQCNDNNACTTDTCDLDRNGCDHPVPDPTCSPCSGSDPFKCGPRCSTLCVGGRCAEVPAAVQCEDNNPCTSNACDPASGCTHAPESGSGVVGCDDGQACNGAEQCVSGTCQTQPVLDCVDDDVCTDDTCSDVAGCVNTPKTGFDAIFCRLQDTQARLEAASTDGGTNARTRTKFQHKVEKLVAKIHLAQGFASSKCPKAKRLLTSAAKQLRSMQRTANRLAGRQLSPTLATMLAQRFGEAAARCDDVKLGLGC